MKRDFTKPDPGLDVFQHQPIAARSGPSALAVLTFGHRSDEDIPPDDVLAGLAAMVVDLVEYPNGEDTAQCHAALMALRTSLDHLCPSSVWPDDTTEIGGRFAWAIRERIAQRLQDLG